MQDLKSRLAPFVPTVLRFALAIVFLAHVHAKMFVYTFPGTEAYFVANGFPAWTVYPVFAAELASAVGLLLGLRTRYVALGLIPVMLGAIKPHLANGILFNNPGGGFEMPALVVIVLGAIAVLGSGALALDNVIGARAGRIPTRASVITAA